jgi:hypothetical protein
MIEIHTLGWSGDHAIDDTTGERPNGQVYARVFVDGTEIPQVVRVRTHHSNDFALAVVTLAGPIEIRTHDKESWKALGEAP